ncbi:MAG: hypothetical protein KF681_01300 [Bdellovibrionaceae bacterium]|nr:hypothetical protein [Pseudobdellovibrionaceae bacterium]
MNRVPLGPALFCAAFSGLVMAWAQAPHPQQQNTQIIGGEVLDSAKVRPSPTSTPASDLLRKMGGHDPVKVDGQKDLPAEEALRRHSRPQNKKSVQP